MALIPTDALPYFEDAIYLPMLISILETDKQLVENGPFKLKRPYLYFIESALKNVRQDSKAANQYLRNHKMKLIRGETTELFTEYLFVHGRYEDARRYLNVRLKSRTEELIGMYFDIAKLQKKDL